MTATKPLVSCIIIFYNAEKFIEEAIHSVLAQSYPAWELILVDDGSEDRSSEIARDFATTHPEKIFYVEHDAHANRGMSASRNLGLRHARGELIGFLDADDIWLPEKLAGQEAILSAHPTAGMVYGRTRIWHSWTGNPTDQQGDYFVDLGVAENTLVQPPDLFKILLKNKAQTPTTCNMLLRRKVLDKIGGFEDSFKGMYEDQVFYAKVHLHFPVYVAGECWAKYRQHRESCSVLSESQQDYCTTRLPFLNWLSDYLIQKGFSSNPQIWRVFQRELRLCRHPRFYQLLTRYYDTKHQLKSVWER